MRLIPPSLGTKLMGAVGRIVWYDADKLKREIKIRHNIARSESGKAKNIKQLKNEIRLNGCGILRRRIGFVDEGRVCYGMG